MATRYLVLVYTGDVPADDDSGVRQWTEQAVVGAASADSAIREVAAKSEITGGRYVAVPLRSWKPRIVTVETNTRVVLG